MGTMSPGPLRARRLRLPGLLLAALGPAVLPLAFLGCGEAERGTPAMRESQDGRLPAHPAQARGLSCTLERLPWTAGSQGAATFAFTLLNKSSGRLHVRAPLFGATLWFRWRPVNGSSYWVIPPPGSFVRPKVLELCPGERYEKRFEVPLDHGEYECYCEYVSQKDDLAVEWHGEIWTTSIIVSAESQESGGIIRMSGGTARDGSR